MYLEFLGERFIDSEALLFLLFRFALNFLSISLLVFAIYYRLNKKNGYLFVLYIFNVLVFFVSSVLGFGVVVSRRFRGAALNHLLAVSVAIVASIVLIEPYGVLGAAWVTFIAFATGCVGSLVISASALSRRELASDRLNDTNADA